MLDVALVTTLLVLLSGAIVGSILGLVGGGGSILALPLLVYLVGYDGDAHVAIGTTALAVAASAFANMLQHRRNGQVHLSAGLWFALPGIAGALLGAQLGLSTQAERLLFLFALLMLFVAWRMWRAPVAPAGDAVAPAGPVRKGRVAAAGLAVGVVSGFFGIGGGFLVVPALLWTAKLDMRQAVGTSLIAVAAFGLATSVRYGLAGKVDLPLAAIFVVGGLAGGLLGTLVGRRIATMGLRRGFALMLIPVAVYMLARNLAVILAWM